jgi:hypothetical protein
MPKQGDSVMTQGSITHMTDASKRSTWLFSVQRAVVAICVGMTINTATAGSLTRGCAARDLQILMLIEERQDASAISSEKLSDALGTMMHARMVCHEGHVVDALEIYESVAKSLAPRFEHQ